MMTSDVDKEEEEEEEEEERKVDMQMESTIVPSVAKLEAKIDEESAHILKSLRGENMDTESLKKKFREGLKKLKQINILLKQNQELKMKEKNERKENISKITAGKNYYCQKFEGGGAK
jgi:hypothetical protein